VNFIPCINVVLITAVAITLAELSPPLVQSGSTDLVIAVTVLVAVYLTLIIAVVIGIVYIGYEGDVHLHHICLCIPGT